MATPDLTSGQVMDASAALNNDAAKTIYTYVKQLPYLNMALGELQELFELNEVPVTATVSAVMTVPAAFTLIGFSPTIPVPGTPYLPSNLIEPSVLWERLTGVNPYTPMTKLNFLPRYQEGVEMNQFIWYTWESQEIRFLAANQINDIKMDYIKNLFAQFTAADGSDQVGVINAGSFLKYRTAGLCAQFIGENKTRADDLNNDAGLAMDRVLGIGAKGRQNIMTRHRPFRAGYKRRTYM